MRAQYGAASVQCETQQSGIEDNRVTVTGEFDRTPKNLLQISQPLRRVMTQKNTLGLPLPLRGYGKKAAEEDGDLRPFHQLLEIVTRPFDEQPEHLAYQQPPAEGEKVLKTFCGT